MGPLTPFTTPRTSSERVSTLIALPLALFLVLRATPAFDGPVAWVVLAVIGLSSLQIWRARIALDHAGVLTVRHVVRTETVDLSRLTAVTAAQRFRSRGAGRHRARRLIQVLELRDADGRELTVEPARWQRADQLVAAVGAAADQAGIPVQGGELFGLAVPAAPPWPAAERGSPPGW